MVSESIPNNNESNSDVEMENEEEEDDLDSEGIIVGLINYSHL